MTNELADLVREHIAEVCAGPSAMRKQGRGVVHAARVGLKRIVLRKFGVGSARRFRTVLDEETEALRKRLPRGARNWGPARKVVNLFLRDLFYNRYTCNRFELHRLEPWLEVPLDSQVAKAIRSTAIQTLPRWKGVKHLDPQVSGAYQVAAESIARENQIARVHLDLYWWRDTGKRNRLKRPTA